MEETASETAQSENEGRSKLAMVAAATGTVAGIAGGLAYAARDTRRRVLGVPLGKRGRFQRAAGDAIDRARDEAGRLKERVPTRSA